MSTFHDEAVRVDDSSATCQPCDISIRVVGAAAWPGLLRRTLDTVVRGTYQPFLRWCNVDHVSARDDEMPSSGREDMDLCTDKVLSKGRILQELTKAVKLVSDWSSSNIRTAKAASLYVYILATTVAACDATSYVNCAMICTAPYMPYMPFPSSLESMGTSCI